REDVFTVARDQHALDSDAEPDPGCGSSTHLLDETVVATAAANSVLRTVERVALEFERGSRVVVESAHEAVLDLEIDTERVQPLLHGLEIGRGLVGEVVAYLGRGVDHVL